MMNSTSKYANLPFIASGERDVYETDDLPESDRILQQQQTHQQQPDSSIEIIPSNSVDAFNKFAVADSIQKSSSLESKESNVSLVEKYKQIQLEIENLQHSIQSNEQSTGDDSSFMPKDIENLFTQLANLHDVCFKKLDTSQLIKDVRREQQQPDDQPIVYELYRKPDKEDIVELARINALEQRLKKIESTIGLNEIIKDSSSSHPLLNNYLKDQSIMDIVINLSNKIVQLDYQSLDRLDARLQLIVDRLQQINEKKSTLTELDKEDRLNELYNCYVKINENRPLLPNILERLQVLNDLQDQASRFANTMTAMETMQNEIKTSLDHNNQNIKNLTEMFGKLSTIQNVVDDFQNRLDKITTKTKN
ncbi:LOW QUALITY PROTEIN: dynactin subunit 2 [Dermatophagoides farinae]|uniref:LOW QUALITY PROTEIN: dynactin subunit 2 n=1 Tax=Dermatophagoides farinae TaxID=6954 RepID=UPI003F641F43